MQDVGISIKLRQSVGSHCLRLRACGLQIWLVGWSVGGFGRVWFGWVWLVLFAYAKVLPQNWLSLRTSCGGVLPQEGWCNVEALTSVAKPSTRRYAK